MMEDAVENKLETREWPHQSECPAAWNGSGAVSARQKQKASSQDERRSGSRLIIFSVKSCEVLIGSSYIVALSIPTTTKESFTIVKE
ncbi:hypothetical protein J4Q44_G00202360 [Coregonus suidteri]|uniref:Uncharacterized protein n=1 Tax=Coregonus suidteri TaxID=861788 RepID=A0AAN8LB28_9TELE